MRLPGAGVIVTQTAVVEDLHNGDIGMDLDFADTFFVEGVGIHAEGLVGKLFDDPFCHFIGVGHHAGGHDTAAVGTDSVIKCQTVGAFTKFTAVIGGKRHHGTLFAFGKVLHHIFSQLIQSLGIGGTDLESVPERIGGKTASTHIGEIFRMFVEIILFFEVVEPAVPGAPGVRLSHTVAAHEKLGFTNLFGGHAFAGLVPQTAALKTGSIGVIKSRDIPVGAFGDIFAQVPRHEPAYTQLFFQKVRHAEPGAHPGTACPVVVVNIAVCVISGNMDILSLRFDHESFRLVNFDESQHEGRPLALLGRLHNGELCSCRLENVGTQIICRCPDSLLRSVGSNDNDIVGFAVLNDRHG